MRPWLAIIYLAASRGQNIVPCRGTPRPAGGFANGDQERRNGVAHHGDRIAIEWMQRVPHGRRQLTSGAASATHPCDRRGLLLRFGTVPVSGHYARAGCAAQRCAV